MASGFYNDNVHKPLLLVGSIDDMFLMISDIITHVKYFAITSLTCCLTAPDIVPLLSCTKMHTKMLITAAPFELFRALILKSPAQFRNHLCC